MILGLTLVLFPSSIVLFLALGWPMRAGFTSLTTLLLPLVWQVAATDSDAPGFAVLLFLLSPISLLLIGIGLVAAIVRLARRVHARRHLASSD